MADVPSPQVLAFDVFGTLVDWHGSIAREVDALGWGVKGSDFALAWRAGYLPAMDRVRRGELGWTRIDDLHRLILNDVLARFAVRDLDEAQIVHLNRVWHRLDPWPDAAAALARLRKRFIVCTLSNGNLSLLANLSKHAGLDWDLILSAETFRHYKPDPETYLGVCETFEVPPEAMMLVAAHKSDLQAAMACGCRGAFIERPFEYGPLRRGDLDRDPKIHYHATDLHDLADQLDCPR